METKLAIFSVLLFTSTCNALIGGEDDVTTITLAPRNTVHIRGDTNPIMECEMTFGSEADGIQWIEYRTDPAQGYAISLNETILAGYEELYRIVNEFHLEFLNPDITAGAKYECRNLLAPQVRAAAELAIIDSGLQWETNATDYDYVIIEGETIRFECAVEHSGSDWIPEVTFDNSVGGIEDEDFDCRIPADGENVVRQCVDILIDQITGDWIYSCTVLFPAPPDNNDPAADPMPPDFEATHNFPALTVHWAPQDMVLDPEGETALSPNDVVVCSAEANPEPNFYQWFDEDDEVIDFGDTLTIPVECAGLRVCVTCLALNEMRDGNLGQGVLGGCYNISGTRAKDLHLGRSGKVTCFNPELKRIRNFQPMTYGQQMTSVIQKSRPMKTSNQEEPVKAVDEEAKEEKKVVRLNSAKSRRGKNRKQQH